MTLQILPGAQSLEKAPKVWWGLPKGKRQGTTFHLDLWCEAKDDFSRACREPPDTLGRWWVSPEGTLGMCVMGRQEDNKRQGEMGGGGGVENLDLKVPPQSEEKGSDSWLP